MKKSSIFILGAKKKRKELEEDFRKNPPLLYGQPMKLEKQGTYLGDDVGVSVSESVTLTINKRIGLVIKGIFEIKSVVEDSRSQRI